MMHNLGVNRNNPMEMEILLFTFWFLFICWTLIKLSYIIEYDNIEEESMINMCFIDSLESETYYTIMTIFILR